MWARVTANFKQEYSLWKNKAQIEVEYGKDCPILFFDLIGEIIKHPYLGTRLFNVPYCAAGPLRNQVENSMNPLKSKIAECKNCSMNSSCGGIFRDYLKKFGDIEFKPILDIPKEVILEITDRCNLECTFCFNHYSGDDKRKNDVLLEDACRVIDEAYEMGVGIFRVSGGEPLLHKDVFRILEYAREKGFREVRLNTNGTLVSSENAELIAKYVDNVLIALNGFDEESECKITGIDSFEKRLRGIRLLKEAGVKVVRSGTIGTRENVEQFDILFDLVKKNRLDAWEWYRPVVLESGAEYLKVLVDRLFELRSEGVEYPIANSIPLCFYDSEKTNAVTLGASADDGNSRIVYDAKGHYKPSYFIGENLGSNLKAAWNSTYMKSIRFNNDNHLIDECKECKYLLKCRGGSRFFSKHFGQDPLIMTEENVELD